MSCASVPSYGKDETLAKIYGLKPLTATEVRKRASTEAAKTLVPQSLTGKQLSSLLANEVQEWCNIPGMKHRYFLTCQQLYVTIN